ncbi:helix-turn-helix domain-containing protein [Actinomadura flavalba]|uniref:helix-turn-helix domain-containing protein n=1 Tax=Actinomadura flavalba TaxID=1120938 RepID=UPI00037E62B6|nr:helix-turn-helix domain-containing protein [Actinomadura flavalba]
MNVSDFPATAVPAVTAEPLLPHLAAAAEEMVREIQRLVPEYARPAESRYGRRMRWAVEETVRQFVAAIGQREVAWDTVTGIFAEIGAYEARRGRSLDDVQTAIRVSGQVACRRFIKDARRLDWPLSVLGQITESLFVFLERIAGAAASGYARAQGQLAGERERHRWRLRDVLVADPPPSVEAIGELAAAAGWVAPRTLAVVAARPAAGGRAPVLPPAMLADWHADVPYLVVPDPAGQERLVATLLADVPAAIGPTVPVTRGAVSLRWAREGLALLDGGAVAAEEPIRCLDHVPDLTASLGAELLEMASRARLAPLLDLPPARRESLLTTLLAYIENRDNAVATAERLMVHEQTVRYRVRRLEAVLGDVMYDPEHRIELLLLLHFQVRMRA